MIPVLGRSPGEGNSSPLQYSCPENLMDREASRATVHRVAKNWTWLKLNIEKTKIMASGPITSWEIDGETVETVSDFIFWNPKSLQMVIAAMKLKDAYSLEEKL